MSFQHVLIFKGAALCGGERSSPNPPRDTLLCMIVHLAERDAPVNPSDLLLEFKPTPRFQMAQFKTYIPNPAFGSQAAALAKLEGVATQPRVRKGFLQRKAPILPSVYLDGGFGVGKTHLLAATFHGFQGRKFLLSFAELTFTIGALGMLEAVKAFREAELVCIDEFELDDVGNTLVVSKFLGELIPLGVRFVATSNTLPEQLGEGRFNADDFKREIQGIAGHFETLRVDGPDYRHRDGLAAPAMIPDHDLERAFEDFTGVKALETFDELLTHLARLHPIRFSKLLEGVEAVFLQGLHVIPKQDDALRFVHLIDKLYDREIKLFASGDSLETLFPASYKSGGYAKKYARCLSRLGELLRESSDL